MINCAHPTHFEAVVAGGGAWTERIQGLRANASTMSHAELDEAEDLEHDERTAVHRLQEAGPPDLGEDGVVRPR